MRRPLALRASPERTFEAFYRRHAPDVYRYALALLASPADAEEVTQTTFLNAHRAIERGEHPRHPRAWLHAIALNLCRQRFRQAARRPAEVPLVDDDVAEVVPDDDAPTLDDLTRALKHLPFNQRAALVMREFEGLSPPQIAAALEVSTSAVETLLFRARRALREQLEGSLTCLEAERAISLQLDGALSRPERGPLRAHLRECPDCASLARSMRAQSGSLKSLAVLPVPSTLAWASGAGSAGAGAGVAGGTSILGSLAAKFVVGTVAATALAGTTYEGVTHAPWRAAAPQAAERSSLGAATPPAAAVRAVADPSAGAGRAQAASVVVVRRTTRSTVATAPSTHAGSSARAATPAAGTSGGQGGARPAGSGPGGRAGTAAGRPGRARPARDTPTRGRRGNASAGRPGAAARPGGAARPGSATRPGAARPDASAGPATRSPGPSTTAEPKPSKPAAPARPGSAARTPPQATPPDAPQAQAPARPRPAQPAPGG